MTNHVQKIAKKLALNQISDAESATKAKYAIEQALLTSHEWQLREDETTLATLSRASGEFNVEWGKLIFAWWTNESAESWRVVAYEICRAEIQIKVTRGMGREYKFFTLRNVADWQPQSAIELSVIERRTKFSALLAQIIQAHCDGVQINRISVRSKFSLANPGQYVRLLLRYRNENILALGINEAEPQAEIDGIIAAGLQWFEDQKTPVKKLWLCVASNPQTILERLTLLDFSAPNLCVECFVINEVEKTMTAVRPFSQGELLSLHPRGLIWPETKFTSESRWRDRVIHLAPDLIEVREDANQKCKRFALHGLEFARTKGEAREKLFFGVAHYPDEIATQLGLVKPNLRKEVTEKNFTQLENLVQEILTFRNADAPDKQHLFYRLRTEAWLESLLRRDIRALDVTLDPRFVYSQVPAWIGEDRGILDLLTINHEGRLVVIEIKAAEDAQLPLQGLDYWLRVEQARIRGEFIGRGLFARVAIANQSPLLYLVAPRLRFHRSFNLLANCIAPEIEAYRIGLNTNWRAGVKVHTKERLRN